MKFSALVSQILLDTFVTRKYTSSKAIHKIAQLTQLKVKQNIRLATPKASELTKKAKGFNQPLVDEKDRILKAIKYKIYKDYNVIGEPGYKMLQKQMKHRFDKLLDSAKQFDKIVSEEINKTKIFKYKKINPNAPLYEMPQSIFDGLYDEY